MNRNGRPEDDIALRRRPVPPLPHPSWSASAHHPRRKAPLAPEEFWERLGL